MSRGSITLRTESGADVCESLQEECCGVWSHSEKVRSRLQSLMNIFKLVLMNRKPGRSRETSDLLTFFYNALLFCWCFCSSWMQSVINEDF